MECTIENKKQIPLTKIVNASIVDTYQDISKVEQRYSHWACRGLKELYSHALPKIKHKVWITVNKNTHTATLPLDFDTECWVGFIDKNWQKVPLKLNQKITDTRNIIDIPCKDACPKCQQDISICNDLVITETSSLIVIGNNTYQQTVVKKLYPNGDYYLETIMPFFDVVTNTVIYPPTPQKEFIVNFDLKPCGCLELDERNTQNLQKYCPDIYCNYYASCSSNCNTSFGGYKIFVESGLIQMDEHYSFDKVYIEYYGFISKINGQYYVPQVAFETLVEWVKLRSIKDKKGTERWRILDQKEDYRVAKGNMMKILGRVSLSHIMQAVVNLPKFDIDYDSHYTNYQNCFTQTPIATTGVFTISGAPVQNITQIINRANFTLSVKTGLGIGHPVDGSSTYQNNVLKQALDLQYIIVAKQLYTLINGDFTFDSITGIINISPNKFFDGDSLIANYNKNT